MPSTHFDGSTAIRTTDEDFPAVGWTATKWVRNLEELDDFVSRFCFQMNDTDGLNGTGIAANVEGSADTERHTVNSGSPGSFLSFTPPFTRQVFDRGEWIFVAIQVESDGTHNAWCYGEDADSAAEDEDDMRFASGTTTAEGTLDRIHLGSNALDTSPFTGDMCFVRFWEAELTPAEIWAESRSRTTVSSTGLVGHWLIDGQTDGDNNDGTIDFSDSYGSGSLSLSSSHPAHLAPSGATLVRKGRLFSFAGW
jgi:hypothetical protein